jgi:hypothetical protein
MAAGIPDSEAVMEYRLGEFVISTSRERLNVDVVHEFLTNCYWAKGIPREVVARSIEHALCFGIYDEEGAQVGFARVISDFATIAYVGDVFVLENLRRWILTTRDAHGLYSQFGFTPVKAPERFMEVHRPNVYETPQGNEI